MPPVDAANRKPRETAENAAAAAAPGQAGKTGYGSLTRFWWVWLVALTLVLHATLAFSWHRSPTPASHEAKALPAEVALGEFRFDPGMNVEAALRAATFSLHVSLVPELDGTARQMFVDRQFRVRQDIESILRQAHQADFEDPHLSGLRRQLREQINQSLGIRAVAEVMVTDLRRDYVPAPSAVAIQPQFSAPGAVAAWRDAPGK